MTSTNPGHKYRILVVDDAHDVCDLIKGYFGGRDVEVVCVYDGHNALLFYHLALCDIDALPLELRPSMAESQIRAGCQHPFDVVLMDIALPGLNGAAIVDNIRHLEKQSSRVKKRTYIIGFSAYDGKVKEYDVDTSVDWDDYIAKPDEKVELLGKLKAALGVE